MTTLVLCVDRSNDIERKAGVEPPVSGWNGVESLVTELGLADPEDSGVNCLLTGLRLTRDLHEDDEDAVIGVVSGASESVIGADRSIAAQLDELVAEYDPDSVVVVIDSAQDERIVPIVESRLPVDGVERVVVRQARDIESTYYLLKQFLADNELRTTVLVPLGIGLLLMPVLLYEFTLAAALSGLAALLGAALLYKGLAIDDRLAAVPERMRDALYSGQVSVVTYVVAIGLALVGAFLGVLEVSKPVIHQPPAVQVALFTFWSVPWLAFAALTASTGRVLDVLIRRDATDTRRSYLNLPFGVVALGFVVRGFAGYFLEHEGVLPHLVLFQRVGWFHPITFSSFMRLAAFVVCGLVVSLVGVRVSTSVSDETLDEVVEQ